MQIGRHELVIRGAPRCARVVHENMHLRLALLDRIRESVAACLRLCNSQANQPGVPIQTSVNRRRLSRRYGTYADVRDNVVAAPGTLLRQRLGHLCRVRTMLACTSYALDDLGLTSLSCFSLRDAMYTLAPFCTYADAIILPMPEPPPVTTAVRVTLSALACYFSVKSTHLLYPSRRTVKA